MFRASAGSAAAARAQAQARTHINVPRRHHRRRRDLPMDIMITRVSPTLSPDTPRRSPYRNLLTLRPATPHRVTVQRIHRVVRILDGTWEISPTISRRVHRRLTPPPIHLAVHAPTFTSSRHRTILTGLRHRLPKRRLTPTPIANPAAARTILRPPSIGHA